MLAWNAGHPCCKIIDNPSSVLYPELFCITEVFHEIFKELINLNNIQIQHKNVFSDMHKNVFSDIIALNSKHVILDLGTKVTNLLLFLMAIYFLVSFKPCDILYLEKIAL